MTIALSHQLPRAAVVLLLLFLSPLLPLSAKAQEDSPKPITLSFGVVPQQSSTTMASRWVPFLRYLSIKSGYRIVFNTAKDIPTFEKRCTAGAYDLAYMNPLHYVIYNISPGYRVFAKEKLKALTGIIVVGKDSSYRELAELRGAELAFPSPGAFAASIVTRGHLKEIGVEFSPHYLTSHDSVYRAVSQGLFAAGGGVPWSLPPGTRLSWTGEGEWKITIDVFRDLGLAFFGALIAIYALLAIPFRSYSQPLLIMLAIPFGLIGAIAGHCQGLVHFQFGAHTRKDMHIRTQLTTPQVG